MIRRDGDDSWELDALNPDVLTNLVADEIDSLIDHGLRDRMLPEEEDHKELIEEAIERFRRQIEDLY